ncbi:dihydrofolate reductase family protein [Roseateles sp. NT4]|uniref:dihydrofolate reductase family protein n=1 Tax=Roseateles sp. NT4 TaxID=3453715 RepID=UPI003EEED1D3
MSKVRVAAFSVSIDGFGAGPRQSLEAPLGVGGEQMHEWMFPTRIFKRMFGAEGGSTGTDDRYAARSFENVGAWILGRNMFGPVRGPWPDEEWKGWWGDEPPYHVPVFVLTHYARPSLEMKGGTVFHFVTGGAEAALKLAKAAAAAKDVRIGGGVSTIRQYLQAGLIDEMHLAVSPVFLGRGESLLGGLDMPALGWRVIEREGTAQALHLLMTRAR